MNETKETKQLTFNDLEVNECFTTDEPFADGVLIKRCGNKAENAEGVYLDFVGVEEVKRAPVTLAKEMGNIMDAKERMEKLLGVNDNTLAAIEEIRQSKEFQRLIVNYDDVPEEQKLFMKKLGVKADKLYFARSPADVSPEANKLRVKLQEALFDNTHSMLGDFLDYMPPKFAALGYPMTKVAYGFPTIEYEGVEIQIDGVSFLAMRKV